MPNRRRDARVLATASIIALMPHAAPAATAETVTFSYDALGRLIANTTSGGVNAGLSQTYTVDAADNRTAKAVTNAPPGGLPDVSAIVLPINGYTIIPVLTTP